MEIWPFLVSRTRTDDYSAVVVPRPFANSDDEHQLARWLDQDAGPEPRTTREISQKLGEVSIVYRVIPAVDGSVPLLDTVGREILWMEGALVAQPDYVFAATDALLAEVHRSVLEPFRRVWQGRARRHIAEPLSRGPAAVAQPVSSRIEVAPTAGSSPRLPGRSTQAAESQRPLARTNAPVRRGMRFYYWRLFLAALALPLLAGWLHERREEQALRALEAQSRAIAAQLELVEDHVTPTGVARATIQVGSRALSLEVATLRELTQQQARAFSALSTERETSGRSLLLACLGSLCLLLAIVFLSWWKNVRELVRASSHS